MIIVIRISGLVEVPEKVDETLYRIRLRRKYSAILFAETTENMKILRKIRDFVAYGKINEETLLSLISARAKVVGNKKIDFKKILDSILKMEKKKKIDLKEADIKPFFRLHSPRGGIKSKIHAPKGVLGDNKEKINDLVRRML